MKRPDGLPIYLTPDDAAALLRTTRKAIYVAIERRQLPGVTRIGRRLLIRTAFSARVARPTKRVIAARKVDRR